MDVFYFACVFGVIILILRMNHFRARWQFRKWSRQLQLNKHEKIYHRLFKNVDGFALSKLARIERDAIEYLYGEIEFTSFIILLSLARPNPDTIFYDLGSGIGKAVVACAMVFDVQKSCGIELFSALHRCAVKQKRRLHTFKDYQDKASRIEYIEGDFMLTDFSRATLIFVNATGFVSPLWEKLGARIVASQCQTLISTSKALEHQDFKIVHKLHIPMSWGPATVFIQERT